MAPSIRAVLAALLVLAAAAGASAQVMPGSGARKPSEPPVVLRKAEPAPAAAQQPPPSPPPLRSDFPGTPAAAPRMGGLAGEPTGGAACRTACARRYYACLSRSEQTDCGAEWTRCQTGCPDISGAE